MSDRCMSLSRLCLISFTVLLLVAPVSGQSPWIYGYHDWEAVVDGGGALNAFNNQGKRAWILATVAVGHNPNDTGGDNFSAAGNHTVIVRLNNGYGHSGTIPVPSQYGNFATRCANYAANAINAEYFVIGNETNLAAEWPMVNGWRSYISPQSYADCFRQVYNAIKAVRPDAKVLSQAMAPFAGPYGAGSDHDAMPLGWTEYMNQMLVAINNTGGLDGIATHINSRGYTYNDVHSTQKVNGQYFSYYVYKDWVNLGTPSNLRHLPYYATECNGIYYWKGGYWECSDCANPSCCYTPGWVNWIYDEINAWNQSRASLGTGIYRCVILYRWSQSDDWNIRNSPQQGQIQNDMNNALAAGYTWPPSGGGGATNTPAPTATNTPTSPPISGSNLALGKSAFASTYFDGNSHPGKAVDGLFGTGDKWTSQPHQPSWWYVDLGESANLEQVRVYSASVAGEPASTNLRAFSARASTTGSGDPGGWTVLGSYDSGGSDGLGTVSIPASGNYRYVGIFITNSGVDAYSRVPEIEVYGTLGAPTATPTPTSTPTNTPGAGSNIAQGKSAFASSSFDSNHLPAKAVDGVISSGSKWTSLSQSPSWWYVDLGTTADLSEIKVHSAGAGGEAAYMNLRAFTVRGSNSNAMAPNNWDILATYNVGGNNGANVVTQAISGGYRFVGIHITNSGIDNYARVPEVQVFGTYTATTWRIEAEDYNNYYDTTSGNSGGAYRSDDVDIEAVQNDGGRFNVGWTAANEWLDFNINVPAATYRVYVRHAGCCSAGSIRLRLNGTNITNSISLPATGGWQTWATKDGGTAVIGSGNNTLRIFMETGNFNINYIDFVPEGGGPTPTPTNTPTGPLAEQNFGSMPSWASTFNASWGSAATWDITSGGQSGNYLRGARASEGSSSRVLTFNVPTNTTINVSIFMRCPTFSGGYWMETGVKTGNQAASDFDGDPGSWTMIKKFDSYGGDNGNGNVWTQYTAQINTGSQSQISVAFKTGSSGGAGPTVGWDTLVVTDASGS